MKVKCIGGPNDGEWHYVPSHIRSNDIVQIQGKLPPLSISDIPEYLRDSITININYYILKEIGGPKQQRYRYLIPHGEDEWKCLVSQLEK